MHFLLCYKGIYIMIRRALVLMEEKKLPTPIPTAEALAAAEAILVTYRAAFLELAK